MAIDMNKKILVFGGTLEGRLLSEYLASKEVLTKVCVATSYGESLLKEQPYLDILAKRLTKEEMVSLMESDRPKVVVDATHPYAAMVTKNIKEACESSHTPYIRLLRPSDLGEKKGESTIYVESTEEAVAYLEQTKGNIFLTTGSKELVKFTKLTGYKNRIFARVLSLSSVVLEATEMGIEGKHLICMQGPFTYDTNKAMMEQVGADILVTKESGTVGGFVEKYEAALALGMQVVVITRPKEKEEGTKVSSRLDGEECVFDFLSCKDYLMELFQVTDEEEKEISIVGIGMGDSDTITVGAKKTIEKAQLLIGARRMLEAVAREDQVIYGEYNPEKVKAYIDSHPQYQKIVIVQSGDVGFYSGAKKLIEVLGKEVKVISGISSPVYFCGKLQIPWSDVKMASLHGRSDNLIGYIKAHKKVFSLIGECDKIAKLCQKLVNYGMGDVNVSIGERLSYPDEKIRQGQAKDFTDVVTDSLAVVLIENKEAEKKRVNAGIPDEAFLRDKVPMTKEEVRTISIGKLQLQKDSVLYDIGAGTGSVSIEAALRMENGSVYGIEKKPAAVELLYKNKKLFGADCLEIIEGLAPQAMMELPVPTHAFIGGSSGNLKEIMEVLLDKNPRIRVVINAITLETIAEALDCVKTLPVTQVDIASVTIGKSENLGSYHLLRGMNPVYVISCTGDGTLTYDQTEMGEKKGKVG